MLRRLLYSLTARLPARYIDHEGQPYLERYYLATLPGLRVYIHRFVGSDPDGLHDHPFRYALSLILCGWYFEDRMHEGQPRRHVRRLLNLIGPKDFHRVVLPGAQDVWTLFMHSARVKPWGFLRRRADGPADSALHYVAQSAQGDPAFSTWHLTAPSGRELRTRQRVIPLGMTFMADLLQQQSPHA